MGIVRFWQTAIMAKKKLFISFSVYGGTCRDYAVCNTFYSV